jgi:phage gpG-like protein
LSGEFSLLGFAEHLAALTVEVEHETQRALEHAAVIVETEAKAEIGTYQDAAGPFAAWSPLADATKRDRVAKGYPEDDPLLREGTMRDSIEHVVIGRTAHVGSNNEITVYQELGTAKIPARSFLRGAAFRKEGEVVETLGGRFVSALTGGAMGTPRGIRGRQD